MDTRIAGEWIELQRPEWVEEEILAVLKRRLGPWDEVRFVDGTTVLVGDINKECGTCGCCYRDMTNAHAVRTWSKVKP